MRTRKIGTRRRQQQQSRRLYSRSRRTKEYAAIQHHHFLLRMETQRCPGPADKAAASDLIHRIIRDIKMQPLDKPHVYYVKVPHYNEGLTAIMPIQTSHIAFHFWRNPEPVILKSANSRCLLEFDIYTCGSLSSQQIQKVLHHLAVFGPTRVDATVINRKWSMTIDRHMHWSADDGEPWGHWVSRTAPRT